MDAVALSRIQFGAMTYFHLLFPAVTMTLGWMLLFFRLRAVVPGGGVWLHAYRFWLPVFAVTLALGCVSGAALLFQADLSFPRFAELAGPAFALAIVLASIGVCLQALGLGVAFLAPGRASEGIETAAVAIAATGATLTALWPAVLAGWMRHPTAVGEFVLPPQAALLSLQLVLGSAVITGFLLAALSAYRQLIGDPTRNATLTLQVGLGLSAGASMLALTFTVLRYGLPPIQTEAWLLQLGYSVLLVSTILLWHLARTKGLSPAPLAGLVVSPLAGWTLLLAGWFVGGTVQSGWLITGILRMDQALAVSAYRNAATTLPLYAATMVVLLVAYWCVLLLMARNTARQSRPNMMRVGGAVQLPAIGPQATPVR